MVEVCLGGFSLYRGEEFSKHEKHRWGTWHRGGIACDGITAGSPSLYVYGSCTC